MQACDFLTRCLILGKSRPHSELQCTNMPKQNKAPRIGLSLFTQGSLRTLTPEILAFHPPKWRASSQVYVEIVLNKDFLMQDLSQPFICYYMMWCPGQTWLVHCFSNISVQENSFWKACCRTWEALNVHLGQCWIAQQVGSHSLPHSESL